MERSVEASEGSPHRNHHDHEHAHGHHHESDSEVAVSAASTAHDMDLGLSSDDDDDEQAPSAPFSPSHLLERAPSFEQRRYEDYHAAQLSASSSFSASEGASQQPLSSSSPRPNGPGVAPTMKRSVEASEGSARPQDEASRPSKKLVPLHFSSSSPSGDSFVFDVEVLRGHAHSHVHGSTAFPPPPLPPPPHSSMCTTVLLLPRLTVSSASSASDLLDALRGISDITVDERQQTVTVEHDIAKATDVQLLEHLSRHETFSDATIASTTDHGRRRQQQQQQQQGDEPFTPQYQPFQYPRTPGSSEATLFHEAEQKDLNPNSTRSSPRIKVQSINLRKFPALSRLFFGPPVDESSCTGLRGGRLVCVHSNPNIYVVPNFLTASELSYFDDKIAAGSSCKKTFKKSYTDSAASLSKNSNDTNRTSTFIPIAKMEDKKIAGIEARAAELLSTTIERIEPLQLVRYLPGQFFGRHHDTGALFEDGSVDLPMVPPRRVATLFVYLNSVPAEGGGATRFPLLCNREGTGPLDVQPERGSAVLWSNIGQDGRPDEKTVHEGRPITGGEKYGMNIWITD